jgi:glycosyltransferase involved in cell wall biosynthesis
MFNATETGSRLVLIGAGSEEAELRSLVERLGIQPRVSFPGWISNPAGLRGEYESSFASASPGFAGLGLTQSAGFGVPMVVASDEPHSPEIELSERDAVEWFRSDDAEDLARALRVLWLTRHNLPRRELQDWISESYSAEAMARGLEAALLNEVGIANED